jgi:hypothetical protein
VRDRGADHRVVRDGADYPRSEEAVNSNGSWTADFGSQRVEVFGHAQQDGRQGVGQVLNVA